jgi:hypothetical protein
MYAQLFTLFGVWQGSVVGTSIVVIWTRVLWNPEADCHWLMHRTWIFLCSSCVRNLLNGYRFSVWLLSLRKLQYEADILCTYDTRASTFLWFLKTLFRKPICWEQCIKVWFQTSCWVKLNKYASLLLVYKLCFTSLPFMSRRFQYFCNWKLGEAYIFIDHVKFFNFNVCRNQRKSVCVSPQICMFTTRGISLSYKKMFYALQLFTLTKSISYSYFTFILHPPQY